MIRLLFTCMFILCIAISCCKEEEKEILRNDPVDGNAVTLSMGDFVDNGTGHNVAGKALILEDEMKKKILRLENFMVINGPDVNVYLSKTPTYKDVIDLGDLKATKGNINYDFDNTINTAEYKYVLIWCVDFAVLFGYAELN